MKKPVQIVQSASQIEFENLCAEMVGGGFELSSSHCFTCLAGDIQEENYQAIFIRRAPVAEQPPSKPCPNCKTGMLWTCPGCQYHIEP